MSFTNSAGYSCLWLNMFEHPTDLYSHSVFTSSSLTNADFLRCFRIFSFIDACSAKLAGRTTRLLNENALARKASVIKKRELNLPS